jgi:hypothetical protein
MKQRTTKSFKHKQKLTGWKAVVGGGIALVACVAFPDLVKVNVLGLRTEPSERELRAQHTQICNGDSDCIRDVGYYFRSCYDDALYSRDGDDGAKLNRGKFDRCMAKERARADAHQQALKRMQGI